MIELDKYDYNKIKAKDLIIFHQQEFLNQLEWQQIRPLWHKILNPFYPAPMPKKYYEVFTKTEEAATPRAAKTFEPRTTDGVVAFHKT